MSTENRTARFAPDQQAVEIRDLPASQATTAAEVKGRYMNRSSTPRNRGVLPPDWWCGGSNG